MVPFPDIDPVALQIGPVAIRWYGLAYVVGILSGWGLLKARAARPGALFTPDDVGDMVFYAALGGVLGGRLGYVLFYNLDQYLHEPASIFAVWQGGMAFHGGVLGFIVATAWFARRRGVSLLAVTDFIVPVVPIGLFFGRIANFINGELWGRVSDVPWAMVFPGGGPEPRHPSQLYEAGLEGVVLFVLLNTLGGRGLGGGLGGGLGSGLVSGVFLLGYGLFRFLIEFAREPDAHLGFVLFDWCSMGQVLSMPMVLLGAFLVSRALARQNAGAARAA